MRKTRPPPPPPPGPVSVSFVPPFPPIAVIVPAFWTDPGEARTTTPPAPPPAPLKRLALCPSAEVTPLLTIPVLHKIAIEPPPVPPCPKPAPPPPPPPRRDSVKHHRLTNSECRSARTSGDSAGGWSKAAIHRDRWTDSRIRHLHWRCVLGRADRSQIAASLRVRRDTNCSVVGERSRATNNRAARHAESHSGINGHVGELKIECAQRLIAGKSSGSG